MAPSNNTNARPMTFQEIAQVIARGESQTVELKKSLTQLKPAMETLCAFLNTDGGIIIIGANHQGKITGQKVTDNTQQEIAKELAKIEPLPASINIQYVDLEAQKDHQLIIISANRGDAAPYTYDSRAWYKNQTTTMRMPQLRYAQLLLEQGAQTQNSWEMQLVEGATIDDLNHDEIQHTIKIAVNINRLDPEALGEPVKDILIKLELMREGKLTNAAMVLFAKSVIPDFSQCMIKMARFRGKTELGGFIDNQMVHGNAFQIMKAANGFIMSYLPVASFFDDSRLERIDKPTLPILAIREALSNAICHRDYSIYNAAITLAIFDDRMEVWNNGALPSSLTIDDLRKRHKSYPRNKKMAKIFYLRGYIETWGTGTTKMIDLCRQNELPEPEFDEYSGGLSVTFKFKEPIGISAQIITSESSLSTRQKTLLALIRKNKTMSLNAIMEQLDDPPSKRMIRKELNSLKEYGFVHLKGYGRSAIWTVTSNNLTK